MANYGLISSNTLVNTAIFSTLQYANTYQIANLPAASSFPGARAVVSDANLTSISFGATVVSGGSTIVPVYSDGTNWKYG